MVPLATIIVFKTIDRRRKYISGLMIEINSEINNVMMTHCMIH